MTGGSERDEALPGDHLPVVPGWNCDTCGAEWPCATKRSRLLREYAAERAALSVYLGSCLAVAAEELRASPVRSLQDRFTGWLPRQPKRF